MRREVGGMKRVILYALLAATVAAGALLASSAQESKPKEEPALEEFEPTEKVPADSSVSFPVDI
jgi:hypothetical protein